jgi:YfiH family protein
MSSVKEAPPEWSHSLGRIHVRFLGRTQEKGARQVLDHLAGPRLALAQLEQIHSSRVLEAKPGLNGEGDALWTSQAGLALCVATADCVPVVVADQRRLAVAHAGWRGIVAGIVENTVKALGEADGLSAWVGPRIGPCCYEVAAEVAGRLIEVSDPSVIRRGRGARPHIDLAAAVAVQLRRSGVQTLRRLGGCTFCQPDQLWSYRRSGPSAGRNLTFTWLGDGE